MKINNGKSQWDIFFVVLESVLILFGIVFFAKYYFLSNFIGCATWLFIISLDSICITVWIKSLIDK